MFCLGQIVWSAASGAALTEESAPEEWEPPLTANQIGPSQRNKQAWRVVDGATLVVFNSGTSARSRVDVGMAAAEAGLMAEHEGKTVSRSIDDPAPASPLGGVLKRTATVA
jgi:hypothetical protein